MNTGIAGKNCLPINPESLISKNHIISSCRIDGQAVFRNGRLIFKNPGKVALPFLEFIYRELGISYPKFYKMDNLSKLGFLATEVLIGVTQFTKAQQENMGVILSNANASLDTDYKYYRSTKEYPSPSLFVYTLPNIMIGEICIRHHFKGENAFFVSKDFNAGFLSQYVDNLINNNILQSCICGWVDLLHDTYKAVLFHVEKGQNNQETNLFFNKKNLEKIYSLDHG